MYAFRDTRADVPPKDEGFYERVNKSAANLQWFGTKFGEAMGVTPNMYEAMFNIADKALPAGKTMSFTNAGNRALRDAAAERVVADPTVGRYFQRSFSASRYPHAYEFFQKAPTKLIQVVNSVRRGKLKDRSTASTSNGDEEAFRPNQGLYNDAVTILQYAPSLSASTPPETLSREESPDTRQQTANSTSQDAQGTRDGFYILKPAGPNILELMSLKHGFPVAVDMASAFGTPGRTPEPNEINIAAIRAGAQTVREKRGLLNMLSGGLKFKFFWIEDDVDKEMEVDSDDTLRAAYCVWLAAEDVSIPFVLCVDDTDLEGAWVNGRMLTEGLR